MNRIIITIAAIALASTVATARPQTLIKCTIAELHDSGYFEESFTAIEYPSLDLEKDGENLDLSIGMSGYNTEDGDSIEYTFGEKGEDGEEDYYLWMKVVLKTEYETFKLTAKTYWNKRLGKLVAIDDDGNEDPVADLVCRGRYLDI